MPRSTVGVLVLANLIGTGIATFWDYTTAANTVTACGSTTAAKCGQNKWSLGTGFTACGGVDQSPVNIATTAKEFPTALNFLFTRNTCNQATFMVTDHDMEVKFPSCATVYSATWSGKVYYLESLRFTSPSEHTVDGKYYPMEMQLVHKALDGHYLFFVVLMDVVPGTTVIGCSGQTTDVCQKANWFDHLLKLGESSQTNAKTVVAAKAAGTFYSANVLSTAINNDAYTGFIPTITSFLYYYRGSYSTPPCTTGVSYLVHPTAVSVFSTSVTAYRQLINAVQGKLLAVQTTAPTFVTAQTGWDLTLGANNRNINALSANQILYKYMKTPTSTASATVAPTLAPGVTTTPGVGTPEATTTLTKATVSMVTTQIDVATSVGFVIGREVIIGTGSNAETRKIVGIGSLTLDKALTYSHGVGTPVVMMSQASTGTSNKPSCHLQIPAECKLPFVYKSLTYTTCTGVDALRTMWCSTDTVYAGHWKECKDPCKGAWPAKKIAGAVIAGSVGATGIGLITAAIVNDAKTGHFDPFAGIKGIKPVGAEKTAPAPTPTQPTVTNGPPFQISPATPGHPGVMGQYVQVPETPTRLLSAATPSLSSLLGQMGLDSGSKSSSFMNGLQNGASGKSAPAPVKKETVVVTMEIPVGVEVTPRVTTMGPEEVARRSTLLFGFIGIMVCVCGCLCSVAAAHLGGFGKKRTRRMNVAPYEAYPQHGDY
jgi:carbonic anhydrase